MIVFDGMRPDVYSFFLFFPLFVFILVAVILIVSGMVENVAHAIKQVNVSTVENGT